MRLLSIGVMCISIVLLAVAGAARSSHDDLQRQVAATERAFAATLQARDHAAFSSYLADEAIFISATGTLRGRDAIAEAWHQHFVGPRAPFSWVADQIEVVQSGTLAYTGGPLYDAAGKRIGRFSAIWRLEAPGRWKIVFEIRGQSEFLPNGASAT